MTTTYIFIQIIYGRNRSLPFSILPGCQYEIKLETWKKRNFQIIAGLKIWRKKKKSKRPGQPWPKGKALREQRHNGRALVWRARGSSLPSTVYGGRAVEKSPGLAPRARANCLKVWAAISTRSFHPHSHSHPPSLSPSRPPANRRVPKRWREQECSLHQPEREKGREREERGRVYSFMI